MSANALVRRIASAPGPLLRKVVPPRPRLRLVRPPRRRHTPAFALLYLVIAGLTVFATVSLNAMAAGDAVDAATLEREVADAEREYGRLVAEVAALEAPERVRDAALALGMIPASQPRYLVVADPSAEDDGEEGVGDRAGAEADPLKQVLSAER